MKIYAVSITSVIPECELCVLVNEDGTATNRFEDGVAGVPKNWAEIAEELFSPSDDRCVGEE